MSGIIRLAKKQDIEDLAIIYKNLYDNVDIGEYVNSKLELKYWIYLIHISFKILWTDNSSVWLIIVLIFPIKESVQFDFNK